MRLDNFFQNPTLFGIIAIVVIVAGQVLSVYFQNKNNKKIRSDNKDNGNKTVSAITDLSNKIQILLDKEVNTVNLQNAENLICSTLRKSEALIKDEVRRVFFHNNRTLQSRQKIIKKALKAVTQTAYNNDINTLSKFFYREKPLSEFLVNINQSTFFKGLLDAVFSKSDNSDTDLQDSLYYIESNFNSYITNAKSYYSNL